MEELCDEAFHAVVLIVDIGIQQSGMPRLRNHIIVGNTCRNQGAMSFFQDNLVAGASDSHLASALDTHGNDKTVILTKIPVERF